MEKATGLVKAGNRNIIPHAPLRHEQLMVETMSVSEREVENYPECSAVSRRHHQP